MGNVTKWKLAEDAMLRRRMGKTGEELGELSSVVSRILIQGIDEVDPASGKPNRQRLEEETGDVYAQLDENVDRLGLDGIAISERRAKKRAHMQEWEQLYRPDYKQRVIDEKEQLDDRIRKLSTFLSTPLFESLDGDQRRDLLEQVQFMSAYATVLERRIARFV